MQSSKGMFTSLISTHLITSHLNTTERNRTELNWEADLDGSVQLLFK